MVFAGISCKSGEKKDNKKPVVVTKEPEIEYVFEVLPPHEGYYRRGDKIVAMAPEGMTERDLGRIVNVDFVQPRRETGQGKIIRDEIDAYSGEGKYCETEQDIAANAGVMAGILNGNVNYNRNDNRVYSWKSYSFRKYAQSFILTKKPPTVDGYIITRIYYGWALNHVFSAQAEYYDSGVDAEIGNSILAGGRSASFYYRKYSNSKNVSWKISSRGLLPKSPEEYLASSPDEVERKYRVGEPRPVLVEYTALSDISRKQLTYNPIYGMYRLKLKKVCVENTDDYDSYGWGWADIRVRLSPIDIQVDARKDYNCIGINEPLIFLYNKGDNFSIHLLDRDDGSEDFIASSNLQMYTGDQYMEFPDGSTMSYYLERIGPLDP